MSGQARHSLFVSAATVGEIQQGVELARITNPEKAAEIETWLNELVSVSRVLSADEHVFREWARLMDRRSKDLIMHALIAATAQVHGLTVATRNIRDFETLGIATVNPFEG
jgi:predicted nucleic acid-binding protein